MLVLDGTTASGVGNNVSSGVGAAGTFNYTLYSVDVLVLYSDVLIFCTTRSATEIRATKRSVPGAITSVPEVAATVVASAPRTSIVTVQSDFSIMIQSFTAH